MATSWPDDRLLVCAEEGSFLELSSLMDAASIEDSEPSEVFVEKGIPKASSTPLKMGPVTDSIASCSSNRYGCAICGKSYRNKSHLKRHISCEHSGKHRCCYCDKQFGSRKALHNHQKVEHSQRSFLCQTCGAGFKKRSHMKEHQESRHSGQKPHACPYQGCSRAFVRKSLLQDHINVHLAVKPHTCSDCSRSFTSKSRLKQHKCRQSKMFKCDKCPKAYVYKAELKRHKEAKHSKKHYACSHCGAEYAWNTGLYRHQRKCNK